MSGFGTGFTFGSASNQPQQQQQQQQQSVFGTTGSTGFSFGGAATSTNPTSSFGSGSTFNFGSPQANSFGSATQASVFGSPAQQQQQQQQQANTGFAFGNTTTSGGFSFGQPAASTSSFSTFGTSGSTGFGFTGTTASTANPTGSVFGTAPPNATLPNNTSGGGIFNFKPNEPAAVNASTSSSLFGGGTSAFNLGSGGGIFSGQKQTSAFGTAPAATTSGFSSFGAAQPSSGSFNFGNTAPNTSFGLASTTGANTSFGLASTTVANTSFGLASTTVANTSFGLVPSTTTSSLFNVPGSNLAAATTSSLFQIPGNALTTAASSSMFSPSQGATSVTTTPGLFNLTGTSTAPVAAAASTNAFIAPTTNSAFSFGSTTKPSTLTFGSTVPTTTSTAPATAGFNFGNSFTVPNAGFTFGRTAAAPISATTVSTAPAAPTSGFATSGTTPGLFASSFQTPLATNMLGQPATVTTAAATTTATLSFQPTTTPATSSGGFLSFAQTTSQPLIPPSQANAGTAFAAPITTTPAATTFGTLPSLGAQESTTASGVGISTTMPTTSTTKSTTSSFTTLPFGTIPAKPATTTVGFNFGATTTAAATLTAAPTTVTTTADSSNVSVITTPPTVTLTTSAIVTSQAALPAVTSSTQSGAAQTETISFRRLEENINKWTLELEEQERTFINQATQVNAWDRILISNGDKIMQLNDALERVKLDEEHLGQEMDFILAQQRELEELLEPLEKSVESMPNLSVHQHADIEREHTFELVENIDAELRHMSSDLKEIIDHINSSSKNQDNTDPIYQIGKILNAHMNTLQWIDENTVILQKKIEEVNQMYDIRKRNQERTLHLPFS